MLALLLQLGCTSLENQLFAGEDPGGAGAGGGDGGTESVGPRGREGSHYTEGPPADAYTLPEEEEDPDGDLLFAEGTIHDFHIDIPDEGRAALAIDPKGWVPGGFRTGRSSWDVTVRLKGTTTFRPLSGKAAFKVDFSGIDPEGRFHGRKRLTLNSMLQDSSMLHEHAAYWLYRHRGVPAPRHGFARVWVNDTYYGLYGIVETMDEQWLDQAFPGDDDGNLFEANLADFLPGQADRFEVEETDALTPPTPRLAALIDAIAATPPERTLQVLTDHFDADTLFDMLAIDLVSGNVDGYTRLRNNYMVYEATVLGRWYITPWGHDQSMQWHRDVAKFDDFSGHLIERCGQDPACAARLVTAIEDLMVDWESGELAAVVSDATGLIAADCREDPRAELGCDVEHVLAFVLDRPRTVRDSLDDAAAEAAEKAEED